jgi:hypothetical protein
MKTKLIIAGGIVAFFVTIFVLTFGGQEFSRFFGKRQENIRREVYEQSNSYNRGMITELASLKREWDIATGAEKIGVEATIRHKFSDFDDPSMPVGLQNFLIRIRGY